MQRDVISPLGQELGRELDSLRGSQAGVGRARAAFVSGTPSRYRRVGKLAPRAYAAGASVLVAAAIVLVAWVHSLQAQPAQLSPLTFTVAGEMPGAVASDTPGVVRGVGATAVTGASGALLVATSELPLAFSDGTRLLLEKEARARVTDVDHLGARVILESGKLHASVIHTGTARWNVNAGPFELHVTGTKFVVAWDPGSQAIDVTLEEGSVVVSGCAPNAPRAVRGGESVHLQCGTIATTTTPSISTSTAVPDAPVSPPSGITQRVAPFAPGPAAQTSTSTSTPTPAAPSVEDLFVQAGEARYAGQLDEAKTALLAVRRHAPGTEKSASAAFELGRLAFDGRGDYAQAALWFDTYLRERPQGTLAREALGRSMEAQDRAGDAELAQGAARTYLARYPSGPHAGLARKLAGGRTGDPL